MITLINLFWVTVQLHNFYRHVDRDEKFHEREFYRTNLYRYYAAA